MQHTSNFAACIQCMTCKLLINTCEDKLTVTVPLCGCILLFKAKTDDIRCRMDGWPSNMQEALQALRQ